MSAFPEPQEVENVKSGVWNPDQWHADVAAQRPELVKIFERIGYADETCSMIAAYTAEPTARLMMMMMKATGNIEQTSEPSFQMSSDVRLQLVSPVSNFNRKFVGKQINREMSFDRVAFGETDREWLQRSSERLATWADFMVTLHVYAARVSLVPCCCIQLQWPVNPWDLERLPKFPKIIFVTCIILIDVPCEVWDFDDGTPICCNCMDDCEVFSSEMIEQGRVRCNECSAVEVCHRCQVQLLDGSFVCLECALGLLDKSSNNSHFTDEHGASFFRGQLFSLTRAQRIRASSIKDMLKEED